MIKFTIIAVLMLLSLSFGDNQMLNINDSAPEFSMLDQNGNSHNLSDFRGKQFVVLIFYPGDMTPVCTQQLCEIRDDYHAFSDNNAVVFGVNPASDKSHKKFATKNNLPFPLLIDNKMQTASKYKCKGAFMNQRTIYVIDKQGTIIYAKRGKPAVSEILASIKQTNENDLKIDLNK